MNWKDKAYYKAKVKEVAQMFLFGVVSAAVFLLIFVLGN